MLLPMSEGKQIDGKRDIVSKYLPTYVSNQNQ